MLLEIIMDESVKDDQSSDTVQTSMTDGNSDEIWEIIDKEDDGIYYIINKSAINI